MAEKMEMDAEVLTEEEDDSDESNKGANLINSSNKRLKRRPVTFPTTRPSRLTGNFHKLLVQRGIIKPTEKKTSKRVSDGSAVRTKRTGKLSEYQPLPLNTCEIHLHCCNYHVFVLLYKYLTFLQAMMMETGSV